MGTLYGFVFLSHQIGGFLGVWLGGKMYDLNGDYTLVWWIGVGVGAFSRAGPPADPRTADAGAAGLSRVLVRPHRLATRISRSRSGV